MTFSKALNYKWWNWILLISIYVYHSKQNVNHITYIKKYLIWYSKRKNECNNCHQMKSSWSMKRKNMKDIKIKILYCWIIMLMTWQTGSHYIRILSNLSSFLEPQNVFISIFILCYTSSKWSREGHYDMHAITYN